MYQPSIKLYKCPACNKEIKIDLAEDERAAFPKVVCECGGLASRFKDPEIAIDEEVLDNNNPDA